MVAAGMTTLVSTAYLDEAERCDRVALLHGGRLLALDAPTALQQRLRGKLLAVRTDAPRRARDLLSALPFIRDAALFGDAVHVALDDAARDWPAARAALVEGGVGILADGPVEPSLEDVFITVVREREAARA
jgi:ABC-2 type transport system ATP-binding protein